MKGKELAEFAHEMIDYGKSLASPVNTSLDTYPEPGEVTTPELDDLLERLGDVKQDDFFYWNISSYVKSWAGGSQHGFWAYTSRVDFEGNPFPKIQDAVKAILSEYEKYKNKEGYWAESANEDSNKP